jgi:GR25 family glycosyltransferase involved in LPS biosynthesis|tara:strand:- start:33 stop:803 length:771 start_codon:yes stop_codon:yes gene_type:complete
MKLDKIYILAIDHTPEKVESIKNKLETMGFDDDIPYEILHGHNGWKSELPTGHSVYKGWSQPESWNDFWKMNVQPGEIGCTITHISAWNKIIEDNVSRALILEEDFILKKPFKDLEEPSENWPYKWDYLNIGRYAFEKDDDIILNDTYCIPALHYNMHSYVLTYVGAQKLISYNLEKNIIPVDEFITATYMNHRRWDIEEIFPVKLINALATNNNWIGQTSDAQSTTVSAHTKTFENPDRMSLLEASSKIKETKQT